MSIIATVYKKDGTNVKLSFNSLTSALEKCRGDLIEGEKFSIHEGSVLLAKGSIKPITLKEEDLYDATEEE